MGSLDNLANARLLSTLVDPVSLDRFLKAMEQDVADTTPDWELALPDIAMYYAEPIITYSNTPELLVVQIPIFLKRRNQVPMSLYSVHTAQVPANRKTYKNSDSQFTQIEVHQPYLAVGPNAYFAMHEPELRLCVKVQQWYMCETAKLQHTVQVHTCVSAIFYQQEAEIKTAQCMGEYIKDEKPHPKILDAGHQLVLSQLPAPWYLDCEGARGLVKHKVTAYAVVNHTEFCEYALQAGPYFLERTTAYCDEGKDARDGKFEVPYVHNQLLFDVLKTRYDMVFKQLRISQMSGSKKCQMYRYWNYRLNCYWIWMITCEYWQMNNLRCTKN